MSTKPVPQAPCISTGTPPPRDRITALVDEAFETHKTNKDGETFRLYPALEQVPPDLFGVSVVSVEGSVCSVGDADLEFAIMSVAKPFVFALVGSSIGFEALRRQTGVNATGLPFNSLAAFDTDRDGMTNPMVNPGAITTTSLAPGDTPPSKWEFILRGLSQFAGRELALDDEVYASVSATNQINQEIAQILQRNGQLDLPAPMAADLYTRQCCLNVTARDLASMGATLANGGVNPLTQKAVVSPAACRHTLAVMLTAGLYERSGDWLYDVGLPGKSGVGGGMVTVSPGKGGLGTFAPRLDVAGNSVKGQLVAKHLSQGLGFHLLTSQPWLSAEGHAAQ